MRDGEVNGVVRGGYLRLSGAAVCSSTPCDRRSGPGGAQEQDVSQAELYAQWCYIEKRAAQGWTAVPREVEIQDGKRNCNQYTECQSHPEAD